MATTSARRQPKDDGGFYRIRFLGIAVMVVGLAWWLALTLPPRFQMRLKERLPDDRLRALLG